MEAAKLRIQDIDFDYLSINIWHAKGGRHRRVTLAPELKIPLQTQIIKANSYYQEDLLRSDYKGVYLPHALAGKYTNAAKEFKWHYIFPSSRLSFEPGTTYLRRHHIHETNIQKAVKNAGRKLNFNKQVTCHNLRHSFQHIYYNVVQISARFKSNWGIQTSELHKYTLMYYRLVQIA